MKTKFLIIGDLHGNKPKIHFKDFDAIIAPGDFCSDKYIRKFKLKWKKANKKSKNVIDFEEFIGQRLGKDKWKEIEAQSLQEGRKILEHLNSFGKPVFIIPGNWDQSYKGKSTTMPKDYANYIIKFFQFWMAKKTNPVLINGLKNIVDCQMRVVNFRDLQFVGYGLSSAPELNAARKNKLKNNKFYSEVLKTYTLLENMVFNLFKITNGKNQIIFLSHNVPYNTKLDILINKQSKLNKMHMGSIISRKAIIKFKPLVCIGGHMHEHFGKDNIGKTVVINAGFGSKVNTLLTIENNKIKELKFYPKPYTNKSY